jgi:hypothetical protein
VLKKPLSNQLKDATNTDYYYAKKIMDLAENNRVSIYFMKIFNLNRFRLINNHFCFLLKNTVMERCEL